MNKNQFDAALQLFRARGKGSRTSSALAAKAVMVDGLSQSEAARQHGVSRQAVFATCQHINAAMIRAERIKALYKRNSGGTEQEIYKVGSYMVRKYYGLPSASVLGCWEVIQGASTKAAAFRYGVTEQAIRNAAQVLREQYELAKEISELV